MSATLISTSPTVVLAPIDCADTAAATSSAVDTNDYEGGVIVIQNKGAGTGTLDGKIQDSADNSSFADVSGLTFSQSTTTADIKAIAAKYQGTYGDDGRARLEAGLHDAAPPR